MDCERLEAEIDEIRRELKELEKKESKLDSYESRNNRLTELTSQWGGATCTMAYRQSLQRLKEELRIQKNLLSDLRKKQINKFSPTTNNGKFGLWKTPYKPNETPTLNPLDYPLAESDDKFGGDESRFHGDDPVVGVDEESVLLPFDPEWEYWKQLHRGQPQPAINQKAVPNPTMFKRLLNTFRTKAKSMFGKGGRRKKTRRKSKK